MFDWFVQIPGPVFIWLFIAFALACIGAAQLWISLDGTNLYPLPSVEEVDPLALAALRGKTPAVIHTALFNLWRRDLVEFQGQNEELKVISKVEFSGTEPIHNILLRHLKHPRRPHELAGDRGLTKELEPHLKAIDQRLEALHLRQTAAMVKRKAWIFWVALTGMMSVGGAKWVLGTMRDKPVFFLSMLLIIAPIVMLVVLDPFDVGRTALGQRYLRSVRKNYRKFGEEESAAASVALWAVALGGYTMLSAFPPYKAYVQAMASAFVGSSSGGCSSSGCGGGSCGGGGCGGGCGGCGG